MKTSIIFCVIQIILFSCVSVPKQAPEFSAELGKKIGTLEQSHLTLLKNFFELKRENIDRFIMEVWLPEFATEFFADKKIEEVWEDVVASQDKAERLQFILFMGPRLQNKINEKRSEFIKPLDDLEREIEFRIREEYTLARSANNTITSFLLSASKISDNQQRYLSMFHISEDKISKVIDKTDELVGELVNKGESISAAEAETKKFLDKIKELKDELNN